MSETALIGNTKTLWPHDLGLGVLSKGSRPRSRTREELDMPQSLSLNPVISVCSLERKDIKKFPKFKAGKKREVGAFRQREVRGRVIIALQLP